MCLNIFGVEELREWLRGKPAVTGGRSVWGRPAARSQSPLLPPSHRPLQQQRQRKTQLEGFHTAYLSLHSEECRESCVDRWCVSQWTLRRSSCVWRRYDDKLRTISGYCLQLKTEQGRVESSLSICAMVAFFGKAAEMVRTPATVQRSVLMVRRGTMMLCGCGLE